MKFTVFSNDLQKAFAKIISVVPSKSTMPILDTVLFELSGNALRLTATDLDTFLTIEMAVTGKQDGRIAIPARRFNETVRSLPNTDLDVSAELSSNKVLMKTEHGEYRMTGESAENFPAEVRIKGQTSIEIDAHLLKGVLNKTLFAISSDELRPAMMGLLVQWAGSELRFVSTDGHRLVKVIQREVASTPTDREVIIPAKGLQHVLKLLDEGIVTITLADANVMFAMKEFQLISRIIDERYPNYESVIPIGNDKLLKGNRQAILAAVRRCALYSSSMTNQIRMFLADNEVRITAEDLDFGGEAKEVIACEYTFEAMEIGFNARYIEDALTHVDTENVQFEFSSPTRAGVIRPIEGIENQEVLLLVMPVRLNV